MVKRATRVEICGGPGVGKTSLAKAFASIYPFGPRVVFERYRDVPFWNVASGNTSFNFERDISFILYHALLINRAHGYRGMLCDFAFFENLAFSRVSCSETEFAIVRSVYNRVFENVSPPKIVLNILCSPLVEAKRIVQRGRIEEMAISDEFLAELQNAVKRELAELQVQFGVSVIDIDSEAVNFIDDTIETRRLCERIFDAL